MTVTEKKSRFVPALSSLMGLHYNSSEFCCLIALDQPATRHIIYVSLFQFYCVMLIHSVYGIHVHSLDHFPVFLCHLSFIK